MIARFFVDRPIFATVISVVFVLAGGVAVFTLPVAQYPDVTPATVQVTAVYPGANAETVRDTVAAPIEEQVSGVEGMLYMSSRCTNDGSYSLTVTFKQGTDSDMAQVLVQNRVSLALPVIPALVQNEGINVKKMSPSTLMIVNLISPDGSHDDIWLSNYATRYVKDELGRLNGVASITYLGQRDYSLRAWLDPDKLAALKLNGMDVVAAIAAQNIQVAAGQIGQPPVPKGQQFQLTINTKGRLSDPEEFADIIIKASQGTMASQGASQAGASGSAGASSTGASAGATSTSANPDSPTPQASGIVRLRDVVTQVKDKDGNWQPRVELGSQQYDQSCTLDGRPSVALSIFQLPGSNALNTAKGVYDKMTELKTRFPDGVDYQIVYDTTPFIHESVSEVFYTLRDAVILVAIVVLLFLQDWRAMILPMIDVPVSLIGTFVVMAAMGFTLNNLTLFGLVLAIGIVVDDAIVVLENIERLIATGLDPRTATIKAMEEITGPVLAITLVLSSVFIPCCFLGGVSGQFFRQFAVTISVSTIISAVNALTMTPSRAVMIFKSEEGAAHGGKHRREALPWWIFIVLGGVLTIWVTETFLSGRFGLPAADVGDAQSSAPWWLPYVLTAAYFVPGALVGAVFGWFLIRPINWALGLFFQAFNRLFDRMTGLYGRAVSRMLRLSLVVMVIYVGLLGLTYWEFNTTPAGFIPQQDKGYLLLNFQLPNSASVERTQQVMAQIDALARRTPGVADTVGISGQSLILNANAPNFGSLYLMLDKFENRTSPSLSADAISRTLDGRLKNLYRLTGRSADALRQAGASDAVLVKLAPLATVDGSDSEGGRWPAGVVEKQKEEAREAAKTGRKRLDFAGTPEDFAEQLSKLLYGDERARYQKPILDSLQKYDLNATVNLFGAPPIDGLGTTGGFKLIVEDRGNLGLTELQRYSDKIVKEGKKSPDLQGLFNSSEANTPWLKLDIDRTKCMVLGVQVSDVFNALQVYLGSYYVNNFNEFGRTWQVNIQADTRFRDRVEDIKELQVKNASNQMIRLGTVMDVSDTGGPVMVLRYNMYSAAAVTGDAGPNASSQQAIDRMQAVANKTLPQSMVPEWTDLAYLQLEAGNSAMWFFALAVAFVFMVLAAQYESWSLPMAVILVVPMCLFCSVVGLLIAHMELNIFTQIGFVVLVGLASKNAILIVEFARQQQQAGVPRLQATLEACRLRLRPILMTSFAFILGVVPLVIASGAGAEMRRALGLAVFSGMLGVTFFGVFLTPVFYYVIQRFSPMKPAAAHPASAHPAGEGGGNARERAPEPPPPAADDRMEPG